jgi:hypothetical protein
MCRRLPGRGDVCRAPDKLHSSSFIRASAAIANGSILN